MLSFIMCSMYGGMVHLTKVGLPYLLHLFHRCRLAEMLKSTYLYH